MTDAQGLAPGDHVLELAHGRRQRSYRLHLPTAGADGPRAVVLAFHGGGGQASGFQAYAGLDPLADRDGFVVAYPNGTGRFRDRLLTWNAGGCCGYAVREKVDDVGFALAVVDDIARRISIDPKRVYATGHSNGAMMSYRLAHEAGHRIAAIAPVGGAMMLSEPFAPPRAVPVLHIHSVDDPRALYAGGLGPPFPLTRHRVEHRAVESELLRWVEHNACASRPHVVAQWRDDVTRHTATRLSWAPCRTGADVEHWRLEGAGHGWPGAVRNLPERLIGPATNVIDAADEVWSFLRRFERTSP
jgi:polyhydroxybutyrate depolymerase